MSAYEGLVERAAKAYADSVEKTLGARVPANGARREAIEAVLAEVLRTLETWADENSREHHAGPFLTAIYASPLSPPKVKP